MTRIAMVRLFVAATVLVGCQAKISPGAAQAGSTIVIPVGGEQDVAFQRVGYGGSQVDDYQRGEMVFTLGDPASFCADVVDGTGNPVELSTRFSTLLRSDPAALATRDPSSAGGYPLWGAQALSIVDIPASAPEGEFCLNAQRVLSDGTSFTFDYEGGRLTILPYVVAHAAGSSVGTPTPVEVWNGLATVWTDKSQELGKFVPDPAIRLGGLPAGIYALQVRIDYPGSTIDIVDVVDVAIAANANRPALVWYEDFSQSDYLIIHAAATDHSISSLDIVFNLDNGAASILDLADVTATVEKAWDASGTPVSASVVPFEIR